MAPKLVLQDKKQDSIAEDSSLFCRIAYERTAPDSALFDFAGFLQKNYKISKVCLTDNSL